MNFYPKSAMADGVDLEKGAGRRKQLHEKCSIIFLKKFSLSFSICR